MLFRSLRRSTCPLAPRQQLRAVAGSGTETPRYRKAGWLTSWVTPDVVGLHTIRAIVANRYITVNSMVAYFSYSPSLAVISVGAPLVGGSSAQFTSFVQAAIGRWAEAVKFSGASVD